MSLQSQQYADLSDDAYNNYRRGVRAPGDEEKISIDGVSYKILEHYSNPRTGYQGTIYQHVASGEITVAHRGTEVTAGLGPLLQDAAIVDGSMVLRRDNPQAQDVMTQ